jgi:hypothetical protein
MQQTPLLTASVLLVALPALQTGGSEGSGRGEVAKHTTDRDGMARRKSGKQT